MSVEIGQQISHYQIKEKLGEGGMGVVYKAHDTSLNRPVALKFLPPHLTKDESSRKRFVVEAQAASALDHPNICAIHEINETADGQRYICMAYYQGQSLRDKIKNGPIPLELALNIFIQIAQGLAVAHEQKIIHRDVKPGNILITKKGEVKIVDFGLAKLAGVDLTKSTSSQGTAAYMCPEQIRGEKLDHRCDIWALGIVFYELVTGELPFMGDYPEPMMYAIVNEQPKLLSEYLKDVPEHFQKIINRLLKKDPAKRYQTVSDVLDDVESFVDKDGSKILKTKPDFVKLLSRKKVTVEDLDEHNKLAVIPIVNTMTDSEQEWFSEGITDTLITKLAQIAGLNVISRNSAFKYIGTSKSPPEIASELGVKYLIEVSAVKLEDTVQVEARLIDAPSDEYIWADEYERKFRNILGLQGEIAKSIARQTKVKLTPQENQLLAEDHLVDTRTYELYMKGMYHLNKYTPEGVKEGFKYLNKAIENNPNDPLAYAGLAIGYNIIAHAPSPPADALIKAKEAATKALEIDDSHAEANLALAMIRIYHDWDIKGSEEAYCKALDNNPSLALAHAHYGWLLRLKGNFEGGHAEMYRAHMLDPRNPEHAADRCCMHYNDGDFDKAISVYEDSLKTFPDFPMGLCFVGFPYAAKGMYDKAIELHQKAGELNADWKWGLGTSYARSGQKNKAMEVIKEIESRESAWESFGLADIYSCLGKKDEAFYWLEISFNQRHPWIQWIRRYRHFDVLKDDPRYENLSKRLNLPD